MKKKPKPDLPPLLEQLEGRERLRLKELGYQPQMTSAGWYYIRPSDHVVINEREAFAELERLEKQQSSNTEPGDPNAK